MSTKLITLNIEGSKHLDRVIPFLKNENADMICLQEIYESDYKEIKKILDMEGLFSYMGDRDIYNDPKNMYKGKWGICFLTKLKIKNIHEHYYHGPFKKNEDISTDSRVLIVAELENCNIATTAFYYTPKGIATKEQIAAFEKMMEYLKKLDKVILCGDFNAPRGGEMFDSFKEYYKDNLPLSIKSTLDPKYHEVGNLNIVVDTIFSSSGINVSEVHAQDGLSDHKAIIGIIN